MSPFDDIQDYCRTACQQIRWQKVRPQVARELQDHLEDQRDAYLAQGQSEPEATREAIRQMGDPVRVGQGLDRSHRPKPQWLLLGLTLLLVAAGFFCRWLSLDAAGQSVAAIWRQLGGDNWLSLLLPCLLGLGVLAAAYFLDVSFLGRYPKTIFGVVLVLSLLGLGNSLIAGGGHRWVVVWRFSISLGSWTLLFPLAYSLLVYGLRGWGYRGLALALLCYGALAWITLRISSAAGFALLSLAVVTVLILAVGRGWFPVDRKIGLLLILTPMALMAVAVTLWYGPWLLTRLQVMLQPASDPQGAGYVGLLVRQVVDGASFWGQGTLPAAYGPEVLEVLCQDYLFTLLLYRWGWLPCLLLLGVFGAFIGYGFWQLRQQRSVLGLLVSLAVLLTFTFQAVTYLAASLGFVAFAALSLPLVSFGDTALLLNLLLIGFMLSVFRDGEVTRERLAAPAWRWRLRLERVPKED